MRQRSGWVGIATVVMTCVLGACSSRSAPEAGPPPRSTTTTTTTTTVATTSFVCEQLNTAAYLRSLDEIGAIAGGKNKPAPDIRRDVAAAYADFANELSRITMLADDEFRPVLADWTSATNEVSAYISGSTPGPDVVVDYGPSFPRWQAAEKAAETVCGHELPAT